MRVSINAAGRHIEVEDEENADITDLALELWHKTEAPLPDAPAAFGFQTVIETPSTRRTWFDEKPLHITSGGE